MTQKLTDGERQTLLRLAREALEFGVQGRKLPLLDQNTLTPALREDGASFVTLTINDGLRGCIGALEAYRPLAQDVREHAIAAALQDHDRAWLVGEPSFGKGVAESVMPLSEGNALVLTTARYFTPQGRSLQTPLPGTALAGILEAGPREFFTDHGRPVGEQGGVAPDQIAEPWILDRWTGILLQTTAFINFAQAYVERHQPISEQFQVDEQMLQDFRLDLQSSGMVIPERDWQRDREFIRMSVHAEVFNLVFGLRKGEEASLRADPQARAAAEAVSKAQQLLAAPAGR